MVFILAETVAGYAIFEATDKAMKNGETLARDLASVEKATSMYVPPFMNPFLGWYVLNAVDFD